MRELGVRKETLEAYGAVSEETAYEMCTGICRHTGSDIGIGITGIAGPRRRNREKAGRHGMYRGMYKRQNKYKYTAF